MTAPILRPPTRAEIDARFTAKFGPCEYDDASHVYKVQGKVVPSITKLKGLLSEPFDGPAIAAKMAAKSTKSAEQILAEWKAIADAGTLTHELVETILMQGVIQRPTDHSKYSTIAHERYLQIRARGIVPMMLAKFKSAGLIPVACELRVWTDKVSGTIDLLAYDPVTGLYHIVDWKLNAKAFHLHPTPWDKPLFAPFDAWTSSHLDQYSVQLESYASIIEAIGLPVGKGVIIHGYYDLFDNYADIHFTDSTMREVCRKWLGIV